MKNTIWRYSRKDKEWHFYRKEPELFIARIFSATNGQWELPEQWFGRNKKYHLRKKKTLTAAKKAVEKWFSDFIKSVS